MRDKLKNGKQRVSYWAGMRIQGPIAPHELKDSFSTKLQTSWYQGGFFGPKHWVHIKVNYNTFQLICLCPELDLACVKILKELRSVKEGREFLVLEGCSFLIKFAKSETGSSVIVIRSMLVLLESLLLLMNWVKNAFDLNVSDGSVILSDFCNFNCRLPLLSKPAETPLVVESFLTEVYAFSFGLD